MSTVNKSSIPSQSVVSQGQSSSITSSNPSGLSSHNQNAYLIIRQNPSKLSSKRSRKSNMESVKSITSIMRQRQSMLKRQTQDQREQIVRIDDYEVEQLPQMDRYIQKYPKKPGAQIENNQKSKLSSCKSSSILNGQVQRDKQIVSKVTFNGKGLNLVSREAKSKIGPFQNKKQEEQSLSYLQDHAERDLINEPDLRPQRNSFHLNMSKSIDSYPVKMLNSFKDALKINFQGIDARQKELCLFKKDEMLKNVIKSPRNRKEKGLQEQITASKRTVQSQSKASFDYFERTMKSDLMEDIEKAKNLQIQQMHQKLKQLEKEKMVMQTKLAVRQNEIRSLKESSVESERNVQFYNTPTASHFNHMRESKGSSLKDSGLYNRGESIFQREIQVHYRSCLEQIKGNNFRKNLIKTKCLALNSEQLEIGCLTHQIIDKNGSLEVTLFITFNSFEVKDFKITCLKNRNIEASVQPSQFQKIHPRKQKKVLVKFQVLKIPFDLPEIEFRYTSTEERQQITQRVTLPLSFNKFVEVFPFHNDFKNQPDHKHLKSNQFRFNSKNIPLEKLAELMNGWSVLSSNLGSGQLMLGARCSFTQTKFNVILNFSIKYSFIEGWLLEGDPKVVQFFVCSLRDIFDNRKK